MAWMFLLVAGLLEIIWSFTMKLSRGSRTRAKSGGVGPCSGWRWLTPRVGLGCAAWLI
jgi:multidrug transporter EmrE-like cation transporter